MEENINYINIKNKFIENFEKEVFSILKKHEDRRIRTNKTLFIQKVCLIIASIVVAFLPIDFECKFKIIPLLIALAVILPQGAKKDSEIKLKREIMPILCPSFGNLTWLEKDNCSFFTLEEKYDDCGLITSYTNVYYDDVFVGNYNGTNFSLEELHCRFEMPKHSHCVFEGVFIEIDFNKEFKGHTVIMPNSKFHNPPKKHLQHTVLEDVLFEEIYDVYTNDEVEARYLITTAFMDRINNLKTAFEAYGARFGFYKDKFIIALETQKDVFSICDLSYSVMETSQYSIMFNEILAIYKLIDYFKLTQKIGL